VDGTERALPLRFLVLAQNPAENQDPCTQPPAKTKPRLHCYGGGGTHCVATGQPGSVAEAPEHLTSRVVTSPAPVVPGAFLAHAPVTARPRIDNRLCVLAMLTSSFRKNAVFFYPVRSQLRRPRPEFGMNSLCRRHASSGTQTGLPQ
jgi:hypothetical protein